MSRELLPYPGRCRSQNFNHDHSLWTIRDGAFIFHLYIPCHKTFHLTIIFGLVTLKFDLLFRNFNIGHNLWTVRDSHVLVTRPFTPYHNFKLAWTNVRRAIVVPLVWACTKASTLDIFNFWTSIGRTFIFHVHFFWPALSPRTINFDQSTLKFNLLFKNINLGHGFFNITSEPV